jgi:hypothetical protein
MSLSFLFFLSRYHYNVTDMQLSQHIAKMGSLSAKYIACCCTKIWAMDLVDMKFMNSFLHCVFYFVQDLVIVLFCSRLRAMYYFVGTVYVCVFYNCN